jgi:ketosteroid isomerase-like protein
VSERNRDTIRRLYDGLDRADGEAMAACYAPDATFSDPVFPDLRGAQVGNMWRMLTSRSTDLSVDLPEHDADEATGSAHWIATYTFRTGRHVVNDIHASFRFDAGGLIAEHTDSFDLWKWSRQALGPIGLVLGWSPIVRGKIRGEAAEGLEEFSASG